MQAGAVLAADALIKALVVARLDRGARHELLPALNLVHVLLVHMLNRGAAFSFLHDAGRWQRYFLIAVAVVASVVLGHLIRRRDSTATQRAAFGLSLTAQWPP